jgi:ferredoxin
MFRRRISPALTCRVSFDRLRINVIVNYFFAHRLPVACRTVSGYNARPNRRKDKLLLPTIDYSLCVGCGACAELYPQFFEIRDDRAWFINHEQFIMDKHKGVVGCCPFRAISIE